MFKAALSRHAQIERCRWGRLASCKRTTRGCKDSLSLACSSHSLCKTQPKQTTCHACLQTHQPPCSIPNEKINLYLASSPLSQIFWDLARSPRWAWPCGCWLPNAPIDSHIQHGTAFGSSASFFSGGYKSRPNVTS